MLDFAHYQVYLQAGIEKIERYLLSDQLFWPLRISSASSGTSYPNLTLGGLLLYHACARPLAQTTSQNIELQQIENQIDATRTRWRVAWDRKAEWEFKSRLRQWAKTIQEIRVDPEDNLGYYRYEVHLRVILDLLRDDLRDTEAASREHIDSLDLLLRALFKTGNFIWEPELAAGFPVDKFWYLWGELKEP